MRFLIVTRSENPVPPDMALPLVEAMGPWLERHASRIEQTWGFAGTQGGGGIAKVDSLEELDEMMADFPFAPFSRIEIYPLVDLAGSLERAKQAILLTQTLTTAQRS